MKKIALFCCYYGKWPNYFDLWLKSSEINNDIDFFFVTDLKFDSDKNNIHIIDLSFDKLKHNIQQLFDFKIRLDAPYKTCDFRPAFGLIFKEYLKGYDWWGFFDIDTVLGDISKFVTEDILEKYDKIYEQGHLQLIRNNSYMNNLFLSNIELPCDTYKEAFTTRRACHYDESGTTAYAKELNFKFYKHPQDMADIDPSSYRFKCFAVRNKNYPPSVIVWKGGNLYIAYVGNDKKVKYQEIDYAHFQKRKMENLVTNIDNGFIAIPNKFIDYQPITPEFIIKNSPQNYNYKEYKKASRKTQFKKLFDGTVPHRIKKFFKK